MHGRQTIVAANSLHSTTMSSHNTTQRSRNTDSLFRRLKPYLIKRLPHSWLVTKTADMKEARLPVRNDAAESNLVLPGSPAHPLSQSDETISQLTSPSKQFMVSQGEHRLQIPHRHTKAELYLRKQHVERLMHDCLMDVEAAKKHYVESQRAFFQANDEQEEIERLIRVLEEEEAITESSQE